MEVCDYCAGTGLVVPGWWPQRLTRVLRPLTKCRNCRGTGHVPDDDTPAASPAKPWGMRSW